jgi:hypothetical protein
MRVAEKLDWKVLIERNTQFGLHFGTCETFGVTSDLAEELQIQVLWLVTPCLWVDGSHAAVPKINITVSAQMRTSHL